MTNTTEIKAEATVDAKTIWSYIKSGIGKTTAVVSDMLKIFWPQWLKAETAWKAWTWTKRGIAIAVLASGGFLAWKFSVDITRLSLGSYRAASTYGRGTEITKDDVKAAADAAVKAAIAKLPTQAEYDDLVADGKQMQADLRDAEERIAAFTPAAPVKTVSTGALPAKKTPKKPASKPSFSVTDPSSWQLP